MTSAICGHRNMVSAVHHSSFIIHHFVFLVIWLLSARLRTQQDAPRSGQLLARRRRQKMLAAGRVLRQDPFSFTRAGRPWVDDQWLAECGMAAVHRLAGWDGLLLATATLLAAVYAWIAARLLARRPASSAGVAAAGRGDAGRRAAVSRPPLGADDRAAGRYLRVAGRRGGRPSNRRGNLVARSALRSLGESARRRVGRLGNRGIVRWRDGRAAPLSAGQRSRK